MPRVRGPTPAPAVPAGPVRAAAPDPTTPAGAAPAPPARPQATVASLAQRAAALRLAGETDKAVLVERQIDAMREREQRVAATEAREREAAEALARGREAAAAADRFATARETDAPPARPAPVPVMLPEAELALIPVPGSLGQQLDVQRVAEERARETAERRALPVSETAALIEQERRQEAERRARTVSAGGVVEGGPPQGPLLPILRPTRIAEVPAALLVPPEGPVEDAANRLGESDPFATSEQGEPVTGTVRAYRDPDTGKYSLPTAGQELVEALARQPVMGEADALAFALEQSGASPEAKSALKNVLTQRVRGQGIVETPLGASLRAVGALTPAFVNTALIGPLLYAADVETTRTAPVAFGADPTARRRVDEGGSFLTQYAQGIQQGRGIGDELAQITPLVKATAEITGENEEYARNALWATGTLSELFLPVTPAGLPGKAAQAAKLGARAAGAGAGAAAKVGARVAPATTRAVGAAADAARAEAGAALGAVTEPLARAVGAVRDRALLGTIARRTYPEAAGLIPRLGSEDDIVGVVSSQRGVPADEVRATLRAQVPDDLVQVSDSVAARRAVASDLLAQAQADVRARFANLTPAEASRVLDDTLVAQARQGRPGLKLMDELTVRSLSPVPPGVEPGLFDGIVARTFAALREDLLPSGAVRPDNALAAALYDRVRASTFRATQDLRDGIVDLARDVNRQNPRLTRAQAKDVLVERIFDRYLGTPDGFEAVLDKIVEDGLGRIGGIDVKRAGKEILRKRQEVEARIAARAAARGPAGAPPTRVRFEDVRGFMNAVADEIGITLPASAADRLLPIMAATIIEDVLKPVVTGERGSALTELARLQRGRAARAGEVTTPSGARVAPRTTTGNQWASGAEASFRPADMFEPEALNAAWTDSIDTLLGKAATIRKRAVLYLASQVGPVPNAPAWLDRFLRGALTSASQIGLARTGAAARDVLRYRYAPGNAVLFTGADGVQWTRDLIKSEGRRVGLGLSAQDSARQGLANQVLIGRVNRELRGARQLPAGPRPTAARLRQMDADQLRGPVRTATVGPDYAAMAGALSDAYREAVFAGALRDGMTVDRAAQVARRSIIDYSLTPTGRTADAVTRYFASAADTWGGMTVLADALRRNPTAPVNVLRMQNALNRTRDPLGVMGDESKRTVLSLPIGPQGYELMVGSNPVVWALEGVLGTLGAIDAGVVGVGEVIAGDQTVLDELGDVAGAGLRLAGGVLLGELEPRTPTAATPRAGVLTDTELLGLLVHLSAPDGQHPEWRPFIDANFPRKIVAPPKESALASEPGYRDLGPLRLWTQVPQGWAEKGLIWERISPAEAESLVRQFPNLADAAPTFVRVYALEPEAKTLLRGLRGRSQGVLDDAARYAAAAAAEGGLGGTVGVPAGTEDPTRVLIEAISRRGVTEPGEAERRAAEALRATRAGE